MYIQMEFCDNQTLRNAIDIGLYKDVKRLWRMFREIIEGLHHIHSQGMIHRDLKPVNIFLDSCDQVKIGDFGLATTNTKSDMDRSVTSGGGGGDESNPDMTGQIGTTLYVAPEINAGNVIAHYSQKVDIYSLGVIFFEMCHPPLVTGMERIKVLSALRSKEVLLPEDLIEQQKYIIKWLLDHDPALRPTSLELLQSDYLPPPQVEEAELQEMVKHTLASHNSKSYKHLINACLEQTMDIKRDIIYDIDVEYPKKFFEKQEYVRRCILNVFRKHGAIQVSVPQLLPKSVHNDVYDKTNAAVVKAVTRSGNVVYLPFDLRVPFARYVARSKILSLKRFNIASVFREKKVFGLQPKERFECAFDIIGPTKNLVSDAEVILVMEEIMREINHFNGYYFRVNHVQLLKGILNHFGINDHQLVHDVLHADVGIDSKKTRMAALAQHIPDQQVVANLFNILEREGSPEQLASTLRPMMRRKHEAANEIKKALQELEVIIGHAKALGVKSKVVICPSLVFPLDYFSGMICHLVVKRKRGYDTLAAGGRFDQLIASFAAKLNIEECHTNPPCGVGISMGVDILAAGISDEDIQASFPRYDVLIHSSSSNDNKKRLELINQLWSRGIRCALCDPQWTVDDVQDHAQDTGAEFIVIFQEFSDTARLRHLQIGTTERYTEKKVANDDLLDKLVKLDHDQGGVTAAPAAVTLETSSSYYSDSSSRTRFLTWFQDYVHIDHKYFPDKKKLRNEKKPLSMALKAKMFPLWSSLATSTQVEVLVLPYPGQVIRSLVASMDFEDDAKFNEGLKELIAKHPRHKEELTSICEDINDLKISPSVFVLFSLEDHTYKVMHL